MVSSTGLRVTSTEKKVRTPTCVQDEDEDRREVEKPQTPTLSQGFVSEVSGNSSHRCLKIFNRKL